MRKILAVLGTAVVALGLAACAGGDQSETHADTGYGDIDTYSVPLDDGRYVICAVFEGYKSGGITCDWEGAK